MKLHFATVPALDPDAATQALKQFLGTHRVVSVDRQLIQDGARSYWSVCITYVKGESEPAKSGRCGVDYRQVLPEAQFAVFAKLREVRKGLAQADGVPPYAVFTNKQLADMVRKPVTNLAELRALPGVGEARCAKYGQAMLDALSKAGG